MIMQEKTRAAGSTSVIALIFIEDSASAGHGKTGLAFNTASLVAYYKRNTAAAPVAITLVTCTLGTFTSSGFKEVDATNQPGIYELHIPNAALITGADEVMITLKGASGMFDCPLKVILGTELSVTERSAIVTQSLTESYAADTVAPTLSQVLFMIYGCVANYYMSGTTITVKKLDKTTTAMEFGTDSATFPTSRLRSL